MTTAAAVVAAARAEIGYREGPNNDTKYGRWYGLNNNTWCAMFGSWVAHTTGALDIIPKHAYTPAGAQWFKSRGRWGSIPKVGAIVYFNFPGDGVDRISHVGIVEAVWDGSIVTIEGNTNADGGREGNGVYRKVRSSGIVGYGYPAYESPVTGFPLPAGEVFGYRKSSRIRNGTESPANRTEVMRIQKRVRAKVTGVFDMQTARRVLAWRVYKKLGRGSTVGPVVYDAMF